MPCRTSLSTAARSSMVMGLLRRIRAGVCPAEAGFCNDTVRTKGTRGMQSWIHVIEWRANVRPELTALVDDRGAAYTYAQLRAETERRAGGWAALGAGSGDVVALVAKNSADFLLHAFALMRAGATPAFVNWRLSPRELTEVLALVEPKAIAADAEFAGLVEAAWPGPLPRVVLGGGPVPQGWLDGAALAGLSGPVPPRPALTGDTVL